MQFMVWGAGTQGKRFVNFISHFTKHKIVGFIDSSELLQGRKILGYEVFSYEEYLKLNLNCPIVICMANKFERDSIKYQLSRDGICFFAYCDCPSEMYFPLPAGIPFDEIFAESNIALNNVAIYGDNLFCVILYDYLVSCGEQPKLTFCNYSILHRYLNTCGYDFISTDRALSLGYRVLHTEEEYCIKDSHSDTHVPFRDFSYLSRYRYEKIVELVNLPIQKTRCFILATGPSLSIDDLEKLYINKEFSVAINRTYLVFDKTDWRPDIFLVGDSSILSQNKNDLLNVDAKYKVYTDQAHDFWNFVGKGPKNLFKYHSIDNAFEKQPPNFSHDIQMGMYGGSSVIYLCIQLMVNLGFKEIYFLGLDFSYKKSSNDDDNHFIKGYSANSIVSPHGKSGLYFQYIAYKKAKAEAEKLGVKIYNASRYTELDVFERVDFDSLFE